MPIINISKLKFSLLFFFPIISVYGADATSTLYLSQELSMPSSQQIVLDKFAHDTSNQNQFWYWLDLAQLQQTNGDYSTSIASFEKAYGILDEYENRAKISLRNIGSTIGSSFFSKGTETFYGKGYERSLMHTLNAINYLMLNKFESAAVEMRRMEQRQEFWLQESADKLKKAAENKQKIMNQGTNIDQMPDGYSMSSLLNNSELRDVVNNYQDPFSYTLSSITSTLAFQTNVQNNVDFKRAVSLNPKAVQVFENNFAKRTLPKSLKSKVTLIILSGQAPAYYTEKIRFPLFHQAEFSSLDVPAYRPAQNDVSTITVQYGKTTIVPPRLLKSDIMAYKTLKDEFLSEFTKSVLRATSKAVTAKQFSDHFGPLGGFVASITLDATSSIMDSNYKNWELLPNSGYLLQFDIDTLQSPLYVHFNEQTAVLPLPDQIGKDIIILVSYISTNTIRIDHVTY